MENNMTEKLEHINETHEDFIGVYENALSSDFCEVAMAQFDYLEDKGFAYTRKEGGDAKTMRDDSAMGTVDLMRDSSELLDISIPTLVSEEFRAGVKYCLGRYIDKFDILNKDRLVNNMNKIQKTYIGGGYHVWHFEDGAPEVALRRLTYVVYLNDVEEGGETEFLYQGKRFKPKQGTVVLFPAGFTHVHRGNPPLSNNKYIYTGWFNQY